MNNSDIIDTTFAVEQAGGNEALAKELFGMLLQELPGLRDKLAQAISDGELEAMWDYAHKIHGGTAYCGVPALRNAVKNLESAIREQDLARIISDFTLTRDEIERLLTVGESCLQEPWC